MATIVSATLQIKPEEFQLDYLFPAFGCLTAYANVTKQCSTEGIIPEYLEALLPFQMTEAQEDALSLPKLKDVLGVSSSFAEHAG